MIFLMYGLASYAFFFVTFLYLMGFATGLVVPKSIESGGSVPLAQAIAVDALLVALFAVQHTIMARPEFKKWWARLIPAPIERSTFVMVATGLFALIMWEWRPIDGYVWQIETPWAAWALTGLALGGFGLALLSSFLIDHFDLFGVRQVVLHARGIAYHHPPFQMPWLYRRVRNPLMLGFLIAFWATPLMSYGHLLFAGLFTVYILFGVRFEERDLAAILGDAYCQYRSRTPMLFPRILR